MNLTTQILRRRNPIEPSASDPRMYVGSGSTLLNLALSDKADGGFPNGKMINLIGDSSSGKTIIALNMLAEAAANPQFAQHKLIFDDIEAANEFDLTKLFGAGLANRIERPPLGEASETVEQLKHNILSLLESGEPFIYVADSFDALTSKDEQARSKAELKALRTGKVLPGSYRMDKAKQASEMLRQITAGLKKTESIVMIISQTRDNIDPMSFSRKTRSGGRALKFYACFEMWTALGKKIKMNDMPVGVTCLLKVTKNKLTGKQRDVEFPIYYGYGIDDIGSCIDYLVKVGAWKKVGGGKIKTGDFKLSIVATRKKLIRLIEKKGLEPVLRLAVEAAWTKIEQSLDLNRKARYS